MIDLKSFGTKEQKKKSLRNDEIKKEKEYKSKSFYRVEKKIVFSLLASTSFTSFTSCLLVFWMGRGGQREKSTDPRFVFYARR